MFLIWPKSGKKDFIGTGNYRPKSANNFYILYKRWLWTGELNRSKRTLGRPKIQTSLKIKKIILDEYKYTKKALYLEKIIYAERPAVGFLNI